MGGFEPQGKEVYFPIFPFFRSRLLENVNQQIDRADQGEKESAIKNRKFVMDHRNIAEPV